MTRCIGEGEIGALSQVVGFSAYRIQNKVDPPVRVEGKLVDRIMIIFERGPLESFTFDSPWGMGYRTLQLGEDGMPRTPMREDVELLEREDSDGIRNGVRRDFVHGVMVVDGKPRSEAFRTFVSSRCNPRLRCAHTHTRPPTRPHARI